CNAADLTTSILSVIDPDRSNKSTRLNGAVEGAKNSTCCSWPFSAILKSSFLRPGRVFPALSVTLTFMLTSADVRTIASLSMALARPGLTVRLALGLAAGSTGGGGGSARRASSAALPLPTPEDDGSESLSRSSLD